jgi:hypothetical protein
LAYFADSCPLDLAPDEAHYWDWSRHLDASYYSKGPLVAFLIRGGSLIAGEWSQRWLGNEMLGVRLPAVLCGALLLVSLYVLTVLVYRREQLAVGVVAFALAQPIVSAGSSLMTIDAPYTCCWGWALVFGHLAIMRGKAWAWPLAGLVVGLGILAKYTMLLWVPSVALFLLTSAAYRRLLFRPGFWIMAATAALCCTPIVCWNFQHNWVSLHHVGGQAGLERTPGLRWLGPLDYLGIQFALLFGFAFLFWAAAMVEHRPWKEGDPGVRYLWWLSAPMFMVFWLFSIKTAEEPNWPVTAYLSGLVLASAWVADRLRASQGPRRRLTLASLLGACVLGVGATIVAHHSEWVQPLLVKLSGPPTAERPMPRRRFDPTCRLRGWRTLVAEVNRLREELRAQGIEPALAADSWTLPGEIGFYSPDHPAVYSFGLALGDRRSQYDLWRPNPVLDPENFRGKTFIVVGTPSPRLKQAFEHLAPSRIVVHSEQGQPVAAWTITVCHGFRGFPDLDKLLEMASY